ncbi:helix-turn-helix domain-containing protein [Rikenella microfusus]|uniref:Helix-turn-helix domain n=1 Tax=Rikenella microfusus TaxID=28139 RepID=A0A379MSX5_9BACT|nr:helix-turn-helix domain-containing protein [Rikenella microfusus]SUE34834.1 Helix-turn-helix domain [Rikenella microfusus]
MPDNIILTTPAQLEEIVQEAVRKVLRKEVLPTEQPAPPDTLNLQSAVQLFRERGYSISTSRIYKLTSANRIPYSKYGARLIFSRAELLQWLDSQTHSRREADQAARAAVARSARNQSTR